METDDPTISMGQAMQVSGAGFPFVYGSCYASFALSPDMIITSADSDNEIESDDESMEIITLVDKRIGINTSVLEEKATACNKLICCRSPIQKLSQTCWML
nr:Ran-binding protein 6 [Tanacetum cinerariifolium]